MVLLYSKTITMNQSNYLIMGLVLGIILTYFLIEIKNKCYLSSSSLQLLNEKIRILLRQSARWSVAADGDRDPMIAVLHANYGTGYLWALNDIATPEQIESATGINYNQFRTKVTQVQDKVTKHMAKVCPQYAPPPSVLTRIGGEN